MLKYMIDTNTAIFVMNNKSKQLETLFSIHAPHLCLSSVALMELVYGAERSARVIENTRSLEGFVARVTVLPYEAADAEHTGQIRAELAAIGNPIGPYDAMIAGQARARGLIVVTNNTKEFVRVSGLRIEDWTANG